jgi:hypothetical protein
MKKHLLLVTIAFGLLVSSCTKYVDLQPANGIVGSWQLLYVDRQDNFGTTTIYTGYEPGIFHFYSNGQAVYDDGYEVMRGTWNTRQLNNGYYDNHGNYHGGTYQVFDLYLSSYSGTRVIDWQFDESWFSNSSRFNALYYGTNSDYKYVFGRR